MKFSVDDKTEVVAAAGAHKTAAAQQKGLPGPKLSEVSYTILHGCA